MASDKVVWFCNISYTHCWTAGCSLCLKSVFPSFSFWHLPPHFSQAQCWFRKSGPTSSRNTRRRSRTTPSPTTSITWTPRRRGAASGLKSVQVFAQSHLARSPGCVSVFQRGDGLQKHDHPVWLGEKAHVGEDRPGPSAHPRFFHLWLALQHRQRVWICVQENQTGCRNQGRFLFLFFSLNVQFSISLVFVKTKKYCGINYYNNIIYIIIIILKMNRFFKTKVRIKNENWE